MTNDEFDKQFEKMFEEIINPNMDKIIDRKIEERDKKLNAKMDKIYENICQDLEIIKCSISSQNQRINNMVDDEYLNHRIAESISVRDYKEEN